jgi:hypothetical protein
MTKEKSKQRIPESILSEIKEKVSIVDYARGLLPLKKQGKDFVANCVFHDEKSPSLSFSEEKMIFHCFGCAAHGDIFDFHSAYFNVDFITAVKAIAEIAKVDITPRDKNNAQPKAPGLTQDAKVILQNIYKECNEGEHDPKSAETIKKIKDKWSAYENIDVAFWPGKDHGNQLDHGVHDIIKAVNYCGLVPADLFNPTPLLFFRDSERKEFKGIIFPNGRIASVKPNIPLVAINKDAEQAEQAMTIYTSAKDAFADKSGLTFAVVDVAQVNKIPPMAKSMLYRYASKLRFQFDKISHEVVKTIGAIYTDEDKISIIDKSGHSLSIPNAIYNVAATNTALADGLSCQKYIELIMKDMNIAGEEAKITKLLVINKLCQNKILFLTKDNGITNEEGSSASRTNTRKPL